jgi:hypothetical protein
MAAAAARAPEPDAACRDLPWAEEARAGRLEAIPAGIGGQLEGAGRIGSVSYRREPIFDVSDRGQDNPLFRFANALHILSREQTVLEQVPFLVPGEALLPLELVEAERILREVDWFFDARVVPVRRCGEEVDLVVVTRDVWTILPTVEFDRSGGESSFAIGVEDENLLGRGETLGVVFEDGVDRSGAALFFFDPAVAGSAWRMNLYAADNDDGHRVDLNLRHPFRSLDERSAEGIRIVDDERVTPLFDGGLRIVEFRQQTRSGRLSLARSTGRVRGHVRRWRAGFAWWDFAFEREPGPLQPGVLPEDRRAVYPFVGFESIEDDFVPLANLALIGRAQDVHFGRRVTAEIGLSPDALGADDGRVLFEASWRDGVRPRESLILTGGLSVNGAVTTSDGEAENLYLNAGTELHVLQTEALRFYASLDGTWTRGLTDDVQLQLGGSRGLRAYPQRFQQGDRRVRARLEQRWYAAGEPLHLFRWGAAVFLDGGRAWFPGDEDDDEEEGWLANVGAGVRLMPTRLPTSGMIHVDLAVPLRTGGRDVDDVQLSITVRNSF